MTKTVDNFTLIGEFIAGQGLGLDYYYHLQVIHRGKDDGTGANSTEIKTYMIDSEHTIERYREEITKLCQVFNARAYINLSPRSKYSTCLGMLETLTKVLREDNYNYLQKIWNSVAGREISSKPLYVIDIDYNHGEVPNLEDIEYFLENCQPFEVKQKIILRVPTMNGEHLITTGFDRLSFSNAFPNVDVHKNNPTLLYASVTTNN